MNEQPPPEAVVLRALKELVRMPSERDEQIAIGPSTMSDPCNRCLAFEMAGTPIPGSETLFAWNGTSTHIHLEQRIAFLQKIERVMTGTEFAREFFANAMTEVKVFVTEIPGYGKVHGHIDVLHPTLIVDWKTIGMKKLADWKKQLAKGEIPLTLQKYISQLTLYIGAARRLGYNIETGVLAFLPRDAITPDDYWTYRVTYSEQNEQALIKRVTDIYAWVKAGRHAEIASDPECVVCHPRYYRR